MKTSDLRIGNWITVAEIPVQVTGVGSSLVHFNDQFGKQDARFIENNVRGIPLTDEWFLKLGFVGPYRAILGFIIYEYKSKFFWIAGARSHFVRVGPDLDMVELKFVHQLQNLYFALTGEELKSIL